MAVWILTNGVWVEVPDGTQISQPAGGETISVLRQNNTLAAVAVTAPGLVAVIADAMPHAEAIG